MPTADYYCQSLTELISKRAKERPNADAIRTCPPPDHDQGHDIELQSLTYAQLQRAVDRVAHYLSSVGLIVPRAEPDTLAIDLPRSPVIAVLVSSSVDETILELALAKAGFVSLLLSVNNSAAAIAHLCKTTGSKQLIYGPKFEDTAREAQRTCQAGGGELKLLLDKRFPLWGKGGIEHAHVEPFKAVYTPTQEKGRPVVILHSSGSTGFPKPVWMTHYSLMVDASHNNDLPGLSTLPAFHGFGHHSLMRCLYAGKPMVIYPPHLPLTASNVIRCFMRAPETQEFFAVPYLLKLLEATDDGIAMLKKFEIVTFAGAPLPEEIGDRLTKAGVNLLSSYASSETGLLMSSRRDFNIDKEWNWLRPSPFTSSFLSFEDRGAGLIECVVKDGFPPKIATNRPDGSYATKDLLIRHPTLPNRYKYVGRLDDTLVHTSGEKTNPLSIELLITGNSPYVQEAIVFGAARPHCGVLLNPSQLAREEQLTAAQVIELAWPAIERANTEAPSHSQLVKEMVGVLPEGTEVPVASKMSILRPACYEKFKDIINTIYERYESGSNVHRQSIESDEEMGKFVRNILTSVIGKGRMAEIDDNFDLFEAGLDSLQAGRVRNACQANLELGGAILGHNVVYEYPTVAKLSSHILSLGSRDRAPEGHEKGYKKMEAMVQKWSSMLEQRIEARSASSDTLATVVLTGATGWLGAHILARLVKDSRVEKVFCLSRAATHNESHKRLIESLLQRRISIPVEFERKVVSYAVNLDLNDDCFGLSQEEYRGIQEAVTHVIHNAWPVNFSMTLDSFDKHVGSTVHLINLCLRVPAHRNIPRFYFSSSISTRMGSPEADCDEDFPSEPSTADVLGYARSKWVVEKICEHAANSTPLQVGVFRIGQMVGDTVHGIWPTSEAFPLLFRSATVVNALPDLDEYPSWLPVDTAGAAIVEILLQLQQPHSQVYHIVNPNASTNWRTIINALRSSGLEFETIDRQEWVSRLAMSSSDVSTNPTFKLLPFYEQQYGSESYRQPMHFHTPIATAVSPTLQSCPQLSKDLVSKWMQHWKETGFM